MGRGLPFSSVQHVSRGHIAPHHLQLICGSYVGTLAPFFD
jgi:hypothetical protein